MEFEFDVNSLLYLSCAENQQMWLICSSNAKLLSVSN